MDECQPILVDRTQLPYGWDVWTLNDHASPGVSEGGRGKATVFDSQDENSNVGPHDHHDSGDSHDHGSDTHNHNSSASTPLDGEGNEVTQGEDTGRPVAPEVNPGAPEVDPEAQPLTIDIEPENDETEVNEEGSDSTGGHEHPVEEE